MLGDFVSISTGYLLESIVESIQRLREVYSFSYRQLGIPSYARLNSWTGSGSRKNEIGQSAATSLVRNFARPFSRARSPSVTILVMDGYLELCSTWFLWESVLIRDQPGSTYPQSARSTTFQGIHPPFNTFRLASGSVDARILSLLRASVEDLLQVQVSVDGVGAATMLPQVIYSGSYLKHPERPAG
ncbi:hypothetical protein PM082_008282 [Marasmius tenuissimus]|nr:hypothetical protein PM082_008282 [Marasmius tenuissimus]